MDQRRRKWEEMEADCLANIFQRLGFDDLILSLPFICKSWSMASRDPVCWKTVDFRPFDFMPWTKLAKRFEALYPMSCFSLSSFVKYAARRSLGSMVELRFPVVFSASMEDLLLVSNECPRLKILALPNLRPEDEVHVPELIGKWKELEIIEMESKPSSFPKLSEQISIKCNNFRGLKMAGSIKEEDVMAIVDHLPKVKVLILNRSYLPKAQLLMIMNGCREIERLSVKDCVGFEAKDEEVMKMVHGNEMFEDEGSRLVDEFDYENDDCDLLHACIL